MPPFRFHRFIAEILPILSKTLINESICHYLLDNYDDLLDLYVDLPDLYVDLSVIRL